MSRKSKPVQMPFESTVPETPDIAAYRAYNPSTALLTPQVEAQYAQNEREIEDQYGAYSGIPSPVARNRLMSLAKDENLRSKGLALAQGNTDVQALKLAQLQSLAGLTRGTKGYNSGFDPNRGSTTNALIGGGATVGAAAIIA